jgi:hypothetical protein
MGATSFNPDNFTFKTAFESDNEIQEYGSNSLMLFTLSMYLRIENIQEFASNAITEGGDDKKVDLCYLDEEEGRVIIAQSYFSQRWGREAAHANKASDLNTAVTWLFSANEDHIPARLKSKTTELRRAVIAGEVKRIEIFFVHNCFESMNVEKELRTVADGTRDKVRALGGSLAENISVSFRELGLNGIEEIYKSRDSDILVDNWLEVPAANYIEEHGDGWKAIVTSVPGDWIRGLYTSYGDRLFSANFRDYLGSVNRKENINQEIKQTATSEPSNFWVYNNGITALTHHLVLDNGSIRIQGISIINGAQTSGALGETAIPGTTSVKVLCRIVESKPQDLIHKIIRYNNTQNEIKPADRRSNDAAQVRLRTEFSTYGITYIHRRSATRTPRNAITAASVAPSLCAFHGDPQTAFRNAKDIFNDENTYRRVFRDNISSEHIYLIATLSSAIDIIKSDLKESVSNSIATKLQEQEYEVLKYSPSKHFLLFIIGIIAEELMNRRVSDLYEWKCRPAIISPSMETMIEAWSHVLHALLPQVATIIDRKKESVYDVQRSTALSTDVGVELKALLASLEPVLGGQFSQLRTETML